MVDFTLGIAGPAGMGIKTVGHTFCRVMMRDGYYVLDNDEYPSLIRGGHNVLFARAADSPIHSHNLDLHLMICLDKASISRYESKIIAGGIIIYDNTRSVVENSVTSRTDIHLLGIPLNRLAIEEGGNIVMINTVALAAAFGLMGHELETYEEVLREQFAHKHQDIIAGNLKAARAGYQEGQKNSHLLPWSLPKKSEKEKGSSQNLLLAGNEAMTLGMINAGCKFYAAYPMTPASAIMSYFAAYEEEYGLIMKHTEDEIAAMNMVIGAWHTGVRAACGTSGGGFALMCEGLGFAGVSEAGVVVILGQRPGPATGIPTFTGQADLRFAIHASQDEFPRIVLAPGNVESCFYEIQNAFNLADSYQTPVIVITDKYLGESHFSCPPLDDAAIPINRGDLLLLPQPEASSGDPLRYKRYRSDTSNGVSPRSIPGVKNAYFLANSYEHDEYGFATEESDERIRQMDKRARKEKAIQSELPMPTLHGPKSADITLITWGSGELIGLEVLRMLASPSGPKPPSVNLLHFTYIFPLDWERLGGVLAGIKQSLCFEGNSQGQLAGLLREKTGYLVDDLLLKYDGRPIAPEEVIEKLKSMSIPPSQPRQPAHRQLQKRSNKHKASVSKNVSHTQK